MEKGEVKIKGAEDQYRDAVENEILIATKNEAKFERYQRVISYFQPNFRILRLSELGIKIKVDEVGKGSEEIARNKALEYLKHSNLPTLAIDEECRVDGIPDEMQPGIYVRRVNRQAKASDEELLNFYLQNYARKSHVWKFSHCLALPNGKVFLDNAIIRAWFSAQSYPGPIVRGYPLSSLLYEQTLRKYWRDFTIEEERTVLQPIYVSMEKILNQAFSPI